MLVFRRAEERDVAEIVSFTQNTWEWGDYVPRVIGRWVEEGMAYVALMGDTVVAVAAMAIVGKAAYLQGLRVRPEYRGRGVGEAFTKFMIEEAKRRGAQVATLLVAEWNTPSHRLVQKVGFRERLKIYGGKAAGSGEGKCLGGLEAYEAVAEALGMTRGYACLPDEPWVCTAVTPWDLLSRGAPCVSEGGLYVGKFSFGKAQGPPGADVTSLSPEGYAERYGAYILYAIDL